MKSGREFQTVGRQPKKPDGHKCWAGNEVLQAVDFGETQMPPSVSTGDWDAIVRQVRWCAAVQTPVNCHCQLEDHLVGHVEPLKFFVQYLTQATVKLPSAGDDARSSVQHML